MTEEEKLESDIGFGAKLVRQNGHGKIKQFIELKGKKIYLRGGKPTGKWCAYEEIKQCHYVLCHGINTIAKIICPEKEADEICVKFKFCKTGMEIEGKIDDGGMVNGWPESIYRLHQFENRQKMIEAIWREFELATIEAKLKDLIIKGERQIVLTGAPGTGKTYTARKIAHYYCLMDDLEKDDKRKELQQEIESKDKKLKNDIEKLPVKPDEAVVVKEYDDLIKEILNNKDFEDIVHKRYKERIKFVQFHSSYDYSDFVEGLRPVVLDEKNTTTFVRMDGIFKAFCREAAEDENKNNNNKYFFIIDEINRADLSKVFGELMYALEDGYRGEENKVQTQYRNLPVYEIDNSSGCAVRMEKDKFKDGFYIPNNVYIIGTMNDIDRSVEAFDFALRRRFQWITVKANNELNALIEIVKKNVDVTNPAELAEKTAELIPRIIAMNNVISSEDETSEKIGQRLGLSEAYHIGHAYFKKYNGDNLADIWRMRIEPLLREYCRGQNSDEVEELVKACRTALGL